MDAQTDAISLDWLFNSDEMFQFLFFFWFQFLNYWVSGHANNLVYCARGEASKQALDENREGVSVHPFVSFAGRMVLCHLIFSAVCITSPYLFC